MPPIESPAIISLTKYYGVNEIIAVMSTLLPGQDTARDVEAKFDAAGALKELWNDVLTYEPKVEKSSKAEEQLLVDDELLRAARDNRPESHLLVWCAFLLGDPRLEKLIREELTDADGHLIPAMVNGSALHARLVQLAIPGMNSTKATSNILSYLETCRLVVPSKRGGTIIGIDQYLPTSYAVPALLRLLQQRALAWESSFLPRNGGELDFALSLGANHWLNLSHDEFRAAAQPMPPAQQPTPRGPTPDSLAELRAQLMRKGQVVLQGPPGTGKTYLAKTYIAWATGNRRDEGHLQRILDDLPLHERTTERVADEIVRRGLPAIWEIVQIHPSYEYTDFVRALVAEPVAGGVTFTPKHRVLSFMSALGKELDKRGGGVELILVMDELNRGNIPAIFGELLYALEYRGEPVATPYSVDGSTSISVPHSLQIIGTMNTADRSIAVIDYALRRRFVFLDIPATAHPIASHNGYKGQRAQRIAFKLFEMVQELVGGATAGIQVGPSYFMPNSSAADEDKVIEGLAEGLVYEVLPLLSEYALEGEIEVDSLDRFKYSLGLQSHTSGSPWESVIEKLLQLTPTLQVAEPDEPEDHAN